MALRYRSVFTKTESPASLDRIAKGLRPPAVKLYLARSRSARPLQHSSLVVIPAHGRCLPRRSVGEGGSLVPKGWLYVARSRWLDRYVTAFAAMALARVGPFV